MICYNLFLQILHSSKPVRMDDVSHCRLLVSALRGIQNIILASRASPAEHLGALLAAIKVYMLHGLGSQQPVPECLYPTPLSQYDHTPQSPSTPKTPAAGKEDEVSLRPSTNKATPKGVVKKGKKKRGGKRHKEKENQDEESVESGMARLNVSSSGGSGEQSSYDVLTSSGGASALVPSWIRVSSSESDYSDTEGGQASKLRAYNSKVRQCSLGCFHAVIKVSINTNSGCNDIHLVRENSHHTVYYHKHDSIFKMDMFSKSPLKFGSFVLLNITYVRWVLTLLSCYLEEPLCYYAVPRYIINNVLSYHAYTN